MDHFDNKSLWPNEIFFLREFAAKNMGTFQYFGDSLLNIVSWHKSYLAIALEAQLATILHAQSCLITFRLWTILWCFCGCWWVCLCPSFKKNSFLIYFPAMNSPVKKIELFLLVMKKCFFGRRDMPKNSEWIFGGKNSSQWGIYCQWNK